MIYAHKILPLFLSPLGLAIICLFCAILFRKRRFSGFALLILWFGSLPVVSQTLLEKLEQGREISSADAVPKADAIVVLSGMLRAVSSGDRIFYEFNDAADRLFAGIDLIEHQKAPLLILTRGQLPWSKGAAEGEVLADLAKKYGVDPKQIRLTPPVQNTDQEARAIAALMPQEQRRIVLVTSAFHMSRAQQVFAVQGLMIHPYPVDFRATYKQANFLDFLPTAEAFEETSLCVREMIGRLYYRLKYPD